MIVFSHIRNTGNTGDLASCPALWFNFPEHRVVNYDEPLPECSHVIYGGGCMNNWLQGRDLPNVASIAWGTDWRDGSKTFEQIANNVRAHSLTD